MSNRLRPFRFLTTAFCLLLFTACFAAAQEALPAPATESPAQKQVEEEEAARRATRKLLDTIIADAATLKLPENRAYLRASAANLLWKFDERAARALFRDAVADLTEVAAGGSANDEAQRRNEARWRFDMLRTEVLTLVAARDPQLALDTMRATRPARSEAETQERRMSGNGDPELSLEQNLIMQVALNDPAQALRLAEASIAKGVTHAVLPLLSSLNEKDSEAGLKLRDALVAKLTTTDFAKDPEAATVAFQLLRMNERQTPPRSLPASSGSAVTPERKPLTLDKAAMRDLSEALITAALDPQNGDRLLWMARSIPPEVEQVVAPARIVQLRRRLAEQTRRSGPRMRAMMEFQPLIERGTTQQVLEAAAKAPAEVRQNLYQMAAMKTLHTDGDAARARAIITEHLPADSPERGELLKQIDQMELQRRIASKQLKEARAALDRLTVPTERLTALAQLATAFAEAKEIASARELLKEAEGLTDTRPRSMEAIGARLMLARAYALVEPERTFQLIEPLIDQANEMLQAASVLSGFMPGGESFRDDEFILRANHQAGGIVSQYLDQLAILARTDFARTVKLTDRFTRPEMQTMARLLIAQSVLAERPRGMNNAMSFGGLVPGRRTLRRR